jgi:ferritin-like protein
MKIEFAGSFEKSLRVMIWHNNPIYKFYALFVYDIPYFLKNIYLYRKMLWNTRWWDYGSTLLNLQTSLEIMHKGFLTGHEEQVSRLKKVAKMERCIQLLKSKIADDYVERIEKIEGELVYHPWEFEDVGNGRSRLIDNDTPEEKEHFNLVYKKSTELENSEWSELWDIIKGKDPKEFEEYKKILSKEQLEDNDFIYSLFDGSDLRSWWD